MKAAKSITAALLLVLVVIVVYQNSEVVETKILFVTLSMPRALLLISTLTVGVVVGLLLGSRFSSGRKRNT